MSELQMKLAADTWIAASWNEYIQIIEYPIYEKTKCYYFVENLGLKWQQSEMTALVRLFC